MSNEYWPFPKFFKTNIVISEKEKQQIKFLLYNFEDSVDLSQITTFRSLNVLDLPVFDELKKQITQILDERGLALDNHWAQLYRKNQYHDPHQHNGSWWSGIIYVDGNGSDGTRFIDSYTGTTYEEKFEKNKLILFPSSVIHYVKNQNEDNGRIVIAFNTTERE
jgi:hypothetical protein|tara:strand:- start:63 stop:554 length:492 start_codon:yes stop_codon:yes gene_type:complete